MQRTNHKKEQLYKNFMDKDLTLSHSVISDTGLIINKTVLRYDGNLIPCILYSTSMSRARIIAQLKSEICQKISLGKKNAALSLSFNKEDSQEIITIFIHAKISGFTPYKSDKPDINFITLKFMNQPPDDFIFRIGEVFSEKTDINYRKEKRIVVDEERSIKINLQTDKVFLYCDGKRNNCIIRDISYSGAKVVARGSKNMFEKKRIMLILNIKNISGIGEMLGTVTYCEEIQSSLTNNLITLGLAFDKDGIPDSYINWLKSFLEKYT